LPIIHSDLRHTKGTTFEIYGKVRYRDAPRTLVANNDLLEFSISDVDNGVPIIYKNSTAGILIADDGSYIITVPATDTERDQLPLAQYRYALRIIEGGNPDNTYELLHGTLFLEDLPFAV